MYDVHTRWDDLGSDEAQHALCDIDHTLGRDIPPIWVKYSS